jgi:hypothetical protein
LIKHHISKNEDAVSIPRLMVRFSQCVDTVHSLEVQSINWLPLAFVCWISFHTPVHEINILGCSGILTLSAQQNADAATCCFAASTRDHPVHLWDAVTGEVCPYSL